MDLRGRRVKSALARAVHRRTPRTPPAARFLVRDGWAWPGTPGAKRYPRGKAIGAKLIAGLTVSSRSSRAGNPVVVCDMGRECIPGAAAGNGGVGQWGQPVESISIAGQPPASA